ncbi:3-isopropylmalate dehydratase large subunit [Aliikangiella marina]|uniref:3-isopropylmalate dehydratase large subunit n=1 Tax=Aliikangiella marina TaxID=1712262 RepID=A0A545TDM1_9GAMM|nr:3-isopropylmalate dehydratase large subunit [Aliikangiella marina]TQV75291.1 3-isopropylmalate dehydratase large subunit [Aliikangiella marina]
MVKTLFDKVWEAHLVTQESRDTPAILYIDTHLIHEVTSPQAFAMLREKKLKVRCPQKTFATMDHSTPTSKPDSNGNYVFNGEKEKLQVEQLKKNCQEFGISLFELGDDRQGIVHVVGPEQGITQPGKTIVCGDSHTSTHGAFGALAFGIGTSEVGYTLATQCIPQRKPKTMGIEVKGKLAPEVSAKDLILAIIAKIGIGGATGHVIEYYGEGISALDMEARMTICNMSIEAGAKAGMIAPDQVTFDYLAGRPYSPKGDSWDRAVTAWSNLFTDEGAKFDSYVSINAANVKPMITYGTNPEMAIPIDEKIPESATQQALNYMGFVKNESLVDKNVDVVFVGSCTNSRITDLRVVAEVLKGQRVSEKTRMLVVPGSHQVKAQAEAENLDQVFIEAGAEWREPGCSMCLGMNGDIIQPGQICVSTSNRNFEGRQGKGGRTILASPRTAAMAAIAGKLVGASAQPLCEEYA